MYTIPLEAASPEQASLIGSKAWNLAQLIQQSVSVPPGFVVSAHALELFLLSNELKKRTNDPDFPHLIQQATIPNTILLELTASYDRLKQQSQSSTLLVAVRSSSSGEDLKEASFAGQYETFLNVPNVSTMAERIKDCWASLFSERVRHYTAQKQLEIHTLPMGVLVQKMVPAEVSGVIFSMNPVSRNRNEVVINASWGLGEAVVSGFVTPDMFVVPKSDPFSIRKEHGSKEWKMISTLTGTQTLPTTPQEQSCLCLTDGQVQMLIQETLRVESYYEGPVDIEFALCAGKLFILQVRPITT